MSSMIYIKAQKKVHLYNTNKVTVGDIGELYGDPVIVNKLKTLKVCSVKQTQKKHKFVISLLEVIKVIDTNTKGITVSNMGEKDILIDYGPSKPKPNKLFTLFKVSVICLTLLCGSAMAIMTFHTDASVPNVFSNINEIFTGEYVERPLWIIIPYSIGLLTGVTVFFNHFSSKKLTEDPTPIQVEMDKYDSEISDCLIKIISSEQSNESDEE